MNAEMNIRKQIKTLLYLTLISNSLGCSEIADGPVDTGVPSANGYPVLVTRAGEQYMMRFGKSRGREKNKVAYGISVGAQSTKDYIFDEIGYDGPAIDELDNFSPEARTSALELMALADSIDVNKIAQEYKARNPDFFKIK